MKKQELLGLVKEAAYEMTIEEGIEKLGWNPIKYLSRGGTQIGQLWNLGKKKGVTRMLRSMGRGWKKLGPTAGTLGAGIAGVGGVGYLGGRLGSRGRRQ